MSEPLAAAASGGTRRIVDDLLARLRAGRRGSLELPTPVLVRRDRRRVTRDYLIWWIRHPDPTGMFATRTRWLRWLPAPLLLRLLFARGYDGLVYVKDDVVVGHVFFQRRGPALHGFSIGVNEPFTGTGYSVAMLFDYVAYASQVPGIVRVRVGRGQNNTTRRFLQRLRKYEDQLAWRVDDDGWVTFHEPAQATRATPANRPA
jgi:RimJ/RimL family protein N-acetyltransferase